VTELDGSQQFALSLGGVWPNKTRRLWRNTLMLPLLLGFSTAASAAIITVGSGGDYTTINDAVSAASGGDEIVEKYSVRIPIGLAPGRVQLLVGDGVTVTTSELQRAPSGVPRDLQQILRELNKLRKTDRLYVKVLSEVPGVVVGGEELPSLPPSMLALMQTGRSSDSNTSGTRSSAVGEFELPASDYVIQGQRSLSLTIIP